MYISFVYLDHFEKQHNVVPGVSLFWGCRPSPSPCPNPPLPSPTHSPLTIMLSRSTVRVARSVSRLSRAVSSQTPSVPAAKSDSSPAVPQVSQSPNHPTTWSTSQRSRQDIYTDVRFEQTALEFQPQPLSAMELINSEPVRIIHGRKAVCDGG